MNEFLFRYERINPASWAYLSSLLTIALYFKFNRVWSIRNIDLIGVLMLAPGLLLVQFGAENRATDNAALAEHTGYVWLFVAGSLLLVRLLFDSTMVRRPLLEPNMSVGGLTFLAISLFVFLMANVITGPAVEDSLVGAQRAEKLSRRMQEESPEQIFARVGPGLPTMYFLPHILTRTSTQAILGDLSGLESDDPSLQSAGNRFIYQLTARVMAILSQLMIVVGMVLIGKWQYDSLSTGIAPATLYLLLPYTAFRTGDVTAALPAALLVWTVVSYRRPFAAGVFLGLATSVIYYPIFLLPLWFSFYWRRGRSRFTVGLLLSFGVVIASLAFTSIGIGEFVAQLRAVFGARLPTMDQQNLGGIWQFWHPAYRLPILAVFLAICFSLAFWPAQKNLAVLLSCSAAIMLGTQFWHARASGIAMGWYLPLALLTVFRPNLEDRIAWNVVALGPRERRRLRSPT